MAETLMEQTAWIAELMRKTAYEEIFPCLEKGVQAEYKEGAGGRELVTEVDRAASKRLLKETQPRYPGSFSEEEIGDWRFLYGELWEFDPLDGTEEAYRGIRDGWAMHGAFLQREGEVYHSRAGVIYVPGRDSLWFGDGKRAVWEQYLKRKEFPKTDASRLRCWVRQVNIDDKTQKYNREGKIVPVVRTMQEYYTNLADRLGVALDIVPGGGSGAHFAELLEGKINLVLLPWDDSKEWDIAMAAPLVKARGGFLCDFAGNEYTYNRRDVLNRNGYVASIAFKKEEIIPHLSLEMVLTKERIV